MRIRLAVALSAVSLVALSGCGSDLGPDLHPGSAAVVGDHKIQFDDVDPRIDEYCELVLPTLKQRGVVQPLSMLRSGYVSLMVEEELARQYAAANDLDVEADIRAGLTRVDDEIKGGTYPANLRDTARDYLTRQTYVVTVQGLVGSAVAQQTGAQATSQDEVLALGLQEIEAWAEEAGVEVSIDPRFDVERNDANALSVAVDDPAKVKSDAEPDPEKFSEYVESLPASQKCGG